MIFNLAGQSLRIFMLGAHLDPLTFTFTYIFNPAHEILQVYNKNLE